jgi:predicted methyltransferase
MPESPKPLPPLLTAAVARALLDALESGETTVEASLDLNLGREQMGLTADGAVLRGIEVSADQLRAVVKKTATVFVVAADGLEQVEMREGGYAKLVPTDGAPTIELSGIRMHRTAGIDPFEDARLKASAVVRSGDAVLDTCGGLGYTALWARRLGAERVVSIEMNPVVIELRRFNPWSLEFIRDSAIEKLEGDVADLILSFPDGSFSCILHDPPRFSLAGHLYGAGFIARMRRVLRSGGRLMFYTGEPYRRGRGRDFVAGVGRRLRDGGLRAVWREELQSFVATV